MVTMKFVLPFIWLIPVVSCPPVTDDFVMFVNKWESGKTVKSRSEIERPFFGDVGWNHTVVNTKIENSSWLFIRTKYELTHRQSSGINGRRAREKRSALWAYFAGYAEGKVGIRMPKDWVNALMKSRFPLTPTSGYATSDFEDKKTVEVALEGVKVSVPIETCLFDTELGVQDTKAGKEWKATILASMPLDANGMSGPIPKLRWFDLATKNDKLFFWGIDDSRHCFLYVFRVADGQRLNWIYLPFHKKQ